MVNANLNNDHVDKLKEEKLPDVVSVWTGLPHDWCVGRGGEEFWIVILFNLSDLTVIHHGGFLKAFL